MNRSNRKLILIVVVALLGLVVTIWVSRGIPKRAAFPTKPGSYALHGWRYDYTVSFPGSRSERRTGRLFKDGIEVTGSIGEIIDTPIGRFVYFGFRMPRYNCGWLNTMAYDRPVFGPDGQVLPTIQEYLR